MLHIKDLIFRFGGRVIFDHATVAIPKGHRVALVGRNGTGKTTLLRLIAGQMPVDGGSITMPAGTRMGMVAQEAPSSDVSLLDTVLAADVERTALLAEAETAADPHRIGEIHTRLADIHAHSAPARAAQILSGLGFDAEAQTRPCSDFSGGWRMRVALAGVLFAAPELLLLDEPTNHLDLEATIWLENYLRNYPHTILLISHDRELLNKVPTTTIHLDQAKLISYTGNYDQFERTRRANLERLAANQTKQIAQRKHIQSYIDRFRYKASKARQAQSRIKMLERMEPLVSIVEDHTVSFDFPSPAQLAPPLIQLEDVDVGYDGKPILRGLDLRIDLDDRIALLGANGNGKSTLVKLLANRLAPMAGEMRRSSKLRIGYFAQHQAEELDLSLTAVAQARLWMKDVVEEKVRAHLGRFGFPQQKADTQIAKLSGGEKARLLFALMTREAPHVLMLDEPTNHLDIDSREALIQAINGFEGAVILISHDPHLIELTADRLLLVDGGACRPYDGDLEDYRKLLMEKRRADKSDGKESDQGGGNKKDQRRAAAELRAALAPLKRKAENAEKLIARLTRDRQELQVKLAEPGLYDGPPDKVTKLQIQIGDLDKKLEAAEQTWLDALEVLEAAESEAAGTA
ncbi:glycosyl transferase family 1 [Skermanella stibiiresistens SB22]|uniref:Glycosyl transferase family 1 n=1 Tax=Skermanella stibiiresistens SB22 TaxID=1385369 RepID=W9H5B4_9PROT|nr:ABC-F family ATP-binding cassette domain-containing protein [Skermanella stibiiresistens]EWY39976.1 glycosyl transferase family 1 [Skermanella stibiiresistens SB22]